MRSPPALLAIAAIASCTFDVADLVPKGGGGPIGGSCPLYQELCGDGCIPISSDPANCGGCGVACGEGLVCSAGTCAGSCPIGLDACGRSCVDRATDDANCGACGHACGTGEGCIEGLCLPTAALPKTNGACPPILERPRAGLAPLCTGVLAETAFSGALCSCGALKLAQHFLADAYDSTRAPYQPGGLGGDVGANGAVMDGAVLEVWGSLVVSSAMGLAAAEDASVKMDLRVGGPLRATRLFTVGGDAFVAGDVNAPAALVVSGTLNVPPGATLTGSISSSVVLRAPVEVASPCACAPAQRVDVEAIVSAHTTDNDDAANQISPTALSDPPAAVRIDLPCGRFFFDAIHGSKPVTIVAHGRAAIFVGGDVHMMAPLRITLDPGAELDLFVRGTLAAPNGLTLGSPSYPALTRVYLSSPMEVKVPDDSSIGAFVYAPAAPVTAKRAFEAFGGLVAGRFEADERASIHYDRAILEAGASCDRALALSPSR
jgi:stigma-specific protein Stig1